MQKLNYGDTGLETKSFEAIDEEFKKLISDHGYNGGDSASPKMSQRWTYILVVNSDNYLDVEYRFCLDNSIYSREEMRAIENKLK